VAPSGPVFTNTWAGVRGVDPEVVEAARGIGFTGRRLLRDVELPLALPVVITGVRITAVQVVATATLGALVGYGGLGRFIVDGFATQDESTSPAPRLALCGAPI
jgi:osmoprotectant transport system permease protein